MKIFAAMSLAAFLLASPVSAFSSTRHWIKEVSDEGGVIILEDNSVWGVESIDKIDSALWLAIDDVIVVKNDDSSSFGDGRASLRRQSPDPEIFTIVGLDNAIVGYG